MSNLDVNNDMNANAQTTHASASAGATHESSLHASDAGADYSGSTGVDASHTTSLPGTPDVGSLSPAADATASAQAVVGDVSASADAALGAAGELGLPALPETGLESALDGSLTGGADVAAQGGSGGVQAAFSGFLDVMGHLVAQFSGSLTAMLGF